MKKTVLYFLICSLFFGIKANAQDNAIDCSLNVSQAITYLKSSTLEKKDSIKAVSLLRDCARKQNPYAQLLLGRLHVYSNNAEKHNIGFQLVKKAANQDYALACSDLGDFYKYGLGCQIDYRKAKRWYKKAHDLGDAKGAYGVGYMFYKGLGDINQNYSRAVRWFEKTTHPMAKHWLGVSYYFGYGVTQNKEKGMALLKNNTIKNSEVMLDCMEFHLKGENATHKNQADYYNILKEAFATTITYTPASLTGTWSGSLMQLDWSGKHIEQELPITFTLHYDEASETTNYTCVFNGKAITGNAENNDNMLFFNDLNIPLKRLYFSGEKEQNIDYQILSSNTTLKTYNDKTYLTAFLSSYTAEMEEPGSDFALILTKQIDETENGKTLSQDAALALSDQKDSFIKLYPNPFKKDFYIGYTLENPGFVNIQVADLHGTKQHIVEQGKQQQKGDYVYHFDGAKLKKGANTITIFVNGVKNTKIIIKK